MTSTIHDVVNDIAAKFAHSSKATLFVLGHVNLRTVFSTELLDDYHAINAKLNAEVLGMIKQRLKSKYNITLTSEWAISIAVSRNTDYICLIHENDPYENEKEAIEKDNNTTTEIVYV
jgi:hypothetical protein